MGKTNPSLDPHETQHKQNEEIVFRRNVHLFQERRDALEWCWQFVVSWWKEKSGEILEQNETDKVMSHVHHKTHTRTHTHTHGMKQLNLLIISPYLLQDADPNIRVSLPHCVQQLPFFLCVMAKQMRFLAFLLWKKKMKYKHDFTCLPSVCCSADWTTASKAACEAMLWLLTIFW